MSPLSLLLSQPEGKGEVEGQAFRSLWGSQQSPTQLLPGSVYTLPAPVPSSLEGGQCTILRGVWELESYFLSPCLLDPMSRISPSLAPVFPPPPAYFFLPLSPSVLFLFSLSIPSLVHQTLALHLFFYFLSTCLLCFFPQNCSGFPLFLPVFSSVLPNADEVSLPGSGGLGWEVV